MHVEILFPYGYCEGVNYALQQTFVIKENNPSKKIYVFGMIVHNEKTVNELKEHGIVTLDEKDTHNTILKKGDILLFPAHGYKKEDRLFYQNLGVITHSLTCPNIQKNITHITSLILRGEKVIFLGKKQHKETINILNLSNKIIFVDYDNHHYRNLIPTNENVYLFTQTTLNIDTTNRIIQELKSIYKNLRLESYLCPVTIQRQSSLNKVNKNTDLLIVIGDYKSSNANRLFEMCKKRYPTKDTILINDISEINVDSIKKYKFVQLVSSASTPNYLVEEIFDFIKTI